MLRYKTETRPGLGALYDIWPGNGVGQILQPWSPHGATAPSLVEIEWSSIQTTVSDVNHY